MSEPGDQKPSDERLQTRVLELETALKREKARRVSLITTYRGLREGFPGDPLQDFFDHEDELVVIDEPWFESDPGVRCVKGATDAYRKQMLAARAERNRLDRARVELAAYRQFLAARADCPPVGSPGPPTP